MERGRRTSQPPAPEPQGARRRSSNMSSLENMNPYVLGAPKVDLPTGFTDRRRRTIGMQALQESIKEKQRRGKEFRTMRRFRISDIHRHIMKLAGEHFGLSATEVEDCMLDDGKQIDVIDNFVEEKGSRALMFFYQEAEVLPPEDTGRVIRGYAKGQKMKKVIATDGFTQELTGSCIYFLRSTTAELDTKNVDKVLTYGYLEASVEGGVLQGLQETLSKIYLPLIKTYKDWGDLNLTPSGQKMRKQFVENVDFFVSTLKSASVNASNIVILKKVDQVDMSMVTTAQDCIDASTDPEKVAYLEEVVSTWCKQVAQVLAESEQMRKEADDTGPLAELEHWRQLNSRFSSILEQIKSHDFRMTTSILHIAKSKILKDWRKQDNKITDAANEAKDNTKYLYTLEKFCEPLYRCDPVGMIECIPSLINAIKMIHNISRYYNTSERMTSLFIKVTNQMVKTCKAYLTDDGTTSVLDMPLDELIVNINSCVKLYESYQYHFQKTNQKCRETGEKAFDFSEMYIFGKFEAFCKRLEKILDLLKIIKEYSRFDEFSHIEGLDALNQKFQVICAALKKKSYDMMDHRKLDFDNDYRDFKRQIGQLDEAVLRFIDDSFAKLPTTLQSLKLMMTIEQLNIGHLDIDAKYHDLLHRLAKDIEHVAKLYHRQREDPPIQRDMPPIAGRIAWARQLARKIQKPMMVYRDRPHLLKIPEAKKVVRNYNRVAQTLMEYEVLYHRAWIQSVEVCKTALQVPVLVRNPNTKHLQVNLDLAVHSVVRESEWMRKLGLHIPESAGVMAYLQTCLKNNHDQLKLLVEEDKAVRSKIPSVFEPLMAKRLQKVDDAIHPGLVSLTWTSMNLELYFTQVKSELSSLDRLIKKIMDIKIARIDKCLKEISMSVLCDLPEKTPWTADEFLQKTEVYCEKIAVQLNNLSQRAEEAVSDLLAIFEEESGIKFDASGHVSAMKKTGKKSGKNSAGLDAAVVLDDEEEDILSSNSSKMQEEKKLTKEEEEVHIFKMECDELFQHFNYKCLDALLKATKQSLDLIRKKVFFSSSMGRRGYSTRKNKQPEAKSPFFKVDIELQIPNIAMTPNLDDIQLALNKASQKVLEVSRGIRVWVNPKNKELPDSSTAPDDKRKINFKSIAEHKDVTKLVMMLSSAVNSFRDTMSKAMKQYSLYHFLWEEDREEYVKEFIETEPILSEFRAEIVRFEEFEEQVNNIEQSVKNGAIEMNTEPLKYALKIEIRAWKMLLCRKLNMQYRDKMYNIIEFIDETGQRLGRQIKDLDDVRHAMAALESIRKKQIEIDMALGPIEESYALLQKMDIAIAQEEMNKVDTVRYNFQKLLRQAGKVQDELVRIQPEFKETLLRSVEKFLGTVDTYEDEYKNNGPMVDGLPPQEASVRLSVFQNRFDELWRNFQTYSGGEELFGLSITDYPFLHKTKKELNLLQKLYGLYNSVMKSINGYYDILWTDVDIDKINQELLDFQNRCRKLPKALKEWEAFGALNKKINDFNESCPVLELMANKAMKDRHWDRIAKCTGHSFDLESENFSLRNIMEADLLPHKEDIEDICISAVKEKDIEAKLKQVIADWSAQNLTFANFKSRGELLLKGGDIGDIISLMEDSLMVLGSLLSNRYNAPFRKSIQDWVSNLSNTTDIIENWMTVQNLWVYLEAVFVGGDIAKQLPQEAKRFQNIDKSWVKIMTRAHETTNVVQCCVGDETLGQLLPHLLEQLELCQKSLTGYLEAKRLVFPRFFFVSDPALLEILGQASDSHTIQAHLLGIFENVNSVDFHEKNYDNILAVVSREGEKIKMEKEIRAQGNVELWLGELLHMQQKSLHGVIREAAFIISEPTFELLKFINEYIAQVGLLGIQMIWTRDAEEALGNARVDKKIMSITNQRFLDILNLLIEQTTRDLGKFERIKYETLITIHVHQRDIFDDLVRMHIKSISDFEWLKQARFYYKEDGDQEIVSITDVNFIYQNEFLGCTDRLVITPLTDRCYITLAQALGMSMGGAPAGPAGTGKTETTKDMGKALGKYVVVFNCSDQMDFRGLGRIYKGLAQSGSWGCFDEFNRIDLPVLSVAAQQIYIVLIAKKERKSEFLFSDGDNVSLNPEFGLFITMNPGYAGRQELPENLKVQFRTVSMMVPDRQIIMRVKLASCGFQENVLLAQKFFVLYKLCEEQLSKQVHYDFGLRNILSVLRTLGSNKRARPEDSESTIVMRVLRDMNVSKLVDEDEPLFLSLISDLFPGIQLDSATYEDLQAAIAHQVEEAKMVNHPSWNLKVIQLFETQRVRHGLMTLGPSGAGKTICINVLMKAMTECGTPHREMRMNPKAITAPQMFGRLDVATNDWTDGIFSTLWRRSHKVKKGEHIWLILDGPVDAVWIENLNSVLDDNKTLTLANGDRITMAPNCKILFEVHNIDNASPATVSRNGMIFMSASALDWRPILQGWLNHRPAAEADILLGVFDRIFEDLYNYAIQSLNAKIELLQSMQIMQACNLLQGLIPVREDKSTLSESHLERLVIFALMWSVGALMELDDRAKIETFINSHESKLDLPPVREGETIFEYVVDRNGGWEHWIQRVEEFIYPSDSVPEFSGILVPNVDNIRTNFLIDTISKQYKGVLLIGEQGTAKTVMIKGYMARYDPDRHLSKSFNFSSATTPMMFQRTVESFVDKRMGSTYGPPGGRRMTCFIDDVNMPVINEWGDQVTNEITRQMMEMNGMYNLEKPGDFTTIVDIQFIAAMIQPGGGRNDIPERLKRQFSIFNCALPSNNSIDKIFGMMGEGYFCSSRFSEDVVELVKILVPATRILWQQTKIKMLPTPAKFHYIFNLRDLSRIWEGMLHIAGGECSTHETLLALWKHECTRVIADRFTNEDDKTWFENCIDQVCKQNIGEEYFPRLAKEPYFVDFLRDAPEPTGEEEDDADLDAPKIYEEIPGWDELKDRLGMFMSMYNEAVRGAQMDLVFFKDAMVHLMKISRVIRTPRGNALLVGVGGSGKQSLTRLASFIAGYKIFQITLSRSYNVSNLMDDLKYLYRVAGGEGKGITFLFTDNEIKDEAFLEYLNNVLSSGEVSNLFARDELDEICQELIPVMKKELPRHPPTPENLYDYFISRARNNLHVVLCFSPVGEKFRNRSLKFPGLISGCTMDWFSKWPRDALVAVSHHFLSVFNIVATPKIKDQLVQMMGSVHDGVAQFCVDYYDRFRRQTHVTPKSYLSFIDGYKAIYTEKYGLIGELAERMNTGLEKLIEASVSVDQLSKELVVKEKDLNVANKKADQVLAEVTQSAQAAEKVKTSVQKVKDKAQAIVDEINVEKGIAEVKLEAARPALEEAEAALQTIKAAHISTVRKLGKPPHLIMRIMDSVLILFQKRLDPMQADPERPCPKPNWGESLKLMSGSGFLANLMSFPKDTINEETVELLEPYLSMEDFNLETAKKVCGDVAGLCSWAKAMAYFYGINKEVLPLKANLAVQENRLISATNELDAAQGQLDEKQKELDAVQAVYDAAMTEKQELLDDAETCRRKMGAATALISGLGGEKIRWTQQSKEFKAQIEKLIGDVLLLTGFLSYSGPFNQEFRTAQQKSWCKELLTRNIPFTPELNLTAMLVDNATIGEWSLQGLPNDELSIQNGIIVTKASRYPLLIDPQGQGKTWIKNREKENSLQVTSLNHKYFRTHLEDALSQGRPLLLEDVEEELDPALDSILEKNFIKSGSTYKVKVGDKECDIMQGFYLYITTKLPNPAYTPEVSAKTSIIDFTVTMKGLEDQLLGRVILTEKQELEAERVKLVEDVTANKRKMQELEDNLLYKLTSTQGSLVDDPTVIEVLNVTKQTAGEVSEKLAVAADTEIKINDAREEFRPVANRGSILYFLICEMSMVCCVYQTSLGQFLGVFDKSMAKSDKSPINSKRIANIIEYLTFEAFRYTCRGLYENHKFLFTLQLALKISINRGTLRHDEFQVLIKGGAALDLNAVQPKPSNCKWVNDMTWLNLVELSKLSQFYDILNQVPRSEKVWRQWFDKDAPEEEQIPDGYSTTLDTFRKLLLIRSWCPDRTIAQARKFIADSMGDRYAEPVLLDLEATWGESNPRVPLICFLSMGSDPTNQIDGLARKRGIECRAISMGQGQEVHARRLVAHFMANGGWALLQNCHLGLNFMDELLDTITEADTIHDSFRVWITTEAHPQFPISVLQASIKFTNEPPQGIKAGIKRTYAGITQDFLDISNMFQWKPMLYCVSFLHTVVQERRKFGPLGWNIPYEFNSADWLSSVQYCQNHLDDMDVKKGVSWNTVRYMLGEVQYGGRVTDDYDKRLLNTFAKVWFGDHIFQASFQFYKGYTVPQGKRIDDYKAFIEEMPVVDSPEAFGLHPNADITYQSNMAKDVLDTIMSIQPKDSGGGSGETRESVVHRMASDMLSKLPPDYVPHEVRDRFKKMGMLQPLIIFLRQEIDRMQRVITVVRNTLTDLQLAIDGTIIMNENLRDALDSMYDARVPAMWRRVSWQSSTIGFWFTELLERNNQFYRWVFEGRPICFWMTGFFNPQGFLTAMRQEVTRAHKGWSLDSVILYNDVTKAFKEDINSPPSEGVYIHGLSLDGASWDKRNCRLVEPQPKVLFTALPVVHMYAIQASTRDPRLYQCPVYKKPNRTDLNYITFILLKTLQSPDHWVLRGVAVLCDIK